MHDFFFELRKLPNSVYGATHPAQQPFDDWKYNVEIAFYEDGAWNRAQDKWNDVAQGGNVCDVLLHWKLLEPP